jgi:C1A family cysteine protease
MIANIKYTWKPDLPDFRDIYYVPPVGLKILDEVNLNDTFTDVKNQLTIGSCTGNSIATDVAFTRVKEGLPLIYPSRLFIYYNERELEGTVDTDSGAEIRDGIKTLFNTGFCPETMWPYDVDKYTIKPTENCYTEAQNHKLKKYMRLNNSNLNDLKSCLSEGYTFVFGFTVYDSFETDEVAQTGIVPMPTLQNSKQGGHAVCCIGYSDANQCFIIRNSWGEDWGDRGNFYLPYNYITNTNLADDFWTLRLI